MDEGFRQRAMRLFGDDRDAAFAEGLAPLLAQAFAGPVTNALFSERGAHYINLLYAMLLLRRSHELEPLHEDLYQKALTPQLLVDLGYSPDLFAHDMDQLREWGCVERNAEALKIRGYKDNRRERFRYRLTEDAVALLDWLESRLAERLEGRVRDSRDRLTDVVGQLRELTRLLESWRKEQRGEERARRAVSLLSSIDAAAHEITTELLTFRAAMLAFAARPYDLTALREILGWLERYVGVYLRRVEELRVDIEERLAGLAQPRFRRALVECRETLLAELEAMPRGLRGSGSLRTTDELIDAQVPFFSRGGILATLCTKIDDSAREVLRKMHRHLRELERRSARVSDLRARVREMAALPAAGDPRLADFVNAVVGAAHGRFERNTALAGERKPPPLPRSHRAATPAGAISRPLRAKQATPEDARALRAKREAELRRWIDEVLLRGEPRSLLSAATLALASDDAPRRWLDVARARHLAGGRSLARLGVAVRDVDGVAILGGGDLGMEAPDAEIARNAEGGGG